MRRADDAAMTSLRTVTLLVLVNCAIEITLSASDFNFVGSPYWRETLFTYGAFYRPLLHDWAPNFALQPVTMFVTYSFLHADLMHLTLNMLVLYVFGVAIVRTVGAAKFLLAYFASAIGGAAAYGMLADGPAPMVGASGALFGLLGVWLCWGYLDRRHYGEGMGEIYRLIALLVAYNVASLVILDSQVAWQTHAGGFITGWVLALFWGRPLYRRRRRPATGPGERPAHRDRSS